VTRAAHRRKLAGFTAIEMLFGIIIAGVLMTASVLYIKHLRLQDRGKTLSTAAQPYHNALVMYGLAKRDALVSVPTGSVTGVANPLEPTCTELRALMPALLDYDCRLPEGAGTPTFTITRIPTGCSGTGCDLAFAVTGNAPVGGSADLEGAQVLQAAVNNFGAEAGQSLVGYGTTIRGTGWQRANPLGNQSRVFGTYATYGASTLSKFVTLYDTRDPNFMGNVSINQSLSVTNTIVAGTSVAAGDGSCKYAEMRVEGRVIVRSPTCVDRVVMDGPTGSVETRSSTGTAQVRITDRVTVFNSSSTDKAGFRFVATASEVYADQLHIVQAQTAGTACPANTFSRDSSGRLLECYSGLWRYPGIHYANVGDACVGGFAQDIANSTAPLICRNNTYINLNQAIGLVSIIDSLVVVNGTTVPAPTCASTAVPILMTDLTRFQTPSSGGTTRLGYTGSGPWTISLTGAGGGEAIVWRGCRYPSF
jgi:type II secretory pathway pseudopilin PulG